MINESFEGVDKKRKRDNNSRFVSSTPIKASNKENFLFSDSNCMEIKSIAELVAERNAFEVVRKPPKKKKKNAEDSCYVNKGLDEKAEEKSINPFEVVRSDNTEAILLAQGFSNQALDVFVNAEPMVVHQKVSTNPFEVVRENELPKPVAGIENTAHELNQQQLTLSLPFTPTVNHRIDFSNMNGSLTPCTLLSSKLVIENNESVGAAIGTPRRNMTVKSRKSLSVISEEEIDISEELDNYQLQLENSINEAKMKNRKYNFDTPKAIEEECENTEQGTENLKEGEADVNNATYTKDVSRIVEVSTVETKSINSMKALKESNVDDEPFIDDNNEDVQFEEVDSFEEDFGKLGQFQRAYRTEAPITFKRPTAMPSSESQQKKKNLAGSIRRSFRKLISHKPEESSDNEKHEGLFQTIRHSLRRKQKPKATSVNLETTIQGRSVFREPSVEECPKKTLERATLKRHVVKTVRTFMESVEEFDHY